MSSGPSERTRFRRGLRQAETEAERRLWQRLRDRRLGGFKFVRQESIERYVADFCCREVKLIVEIDGGHHAESAQDAVRDAWLGTLGYRVLRFWNAEIMSNTVGVLDTIFAALPPSPRPRGEGRAPLVGGEASVSEGEGAAKGDAHAAPPPHPRLPPRSGDDAVAGALSPSKSGPPDFGAFMRIPGKPGVRAGRGEVRS